VKKAYLGRFPIRLLVGAVLGAMVLWLQPAGLVLAHSVLARSDPAADSVLQQSPDRVTLWFTEPIDIKFSEVKVLDAENEQWDNGDIANYQNDPASITVSVQKLPHGVYTVAWHNTSAVDGHSAGGSFVFYLGITPSGVPSQSVQAQPLLQSPFEPFLHWIELLGILVMMGSLIFEVFITRPVLAAGKTSRSFKDMDLHMEYRTLFVILLAASVSFVGSLGELFVKAIVARTALGSISLSHVIDVLLQTHWGVLWVWRMLIQLVAIGLPLFVLVDWSPRRSGQRVWQIVALALSAIVLFLFSMVSHGAATTAVQAPAVFSDYVHLLAASVWIGGIIYLALVMPAAMRRYRRETLDTGAATFCPTSHVEALGRFSFLAIVSAGTLIITGLYSSWAQVTILPALITPYGMTLLIKIMLTLFLAALGAVNLIWVRPRLPEDRKALSVLKKVTGAQATLAVVIVLSVGILVSLNPARQAVTTKETAQPAISVKDSDDWARITMQIEPGNVGPNQFVVSLKDSGGKAVNDASSVGLLINCLSTDLGGYWQYAAPAGKGKYLLQTDLPIAGPWQANITIQRPDSFDVNTSLKFDVLASGTGSVNVIAPSHNTGIILWGIEVLMIGLTVILARWLTNYFSKSRKKNTFPSH
jgi:copper transport protein